MSTGALSGTVGASLSEPIKVRVTDADGRGVPGVEVTFEVPLGSGSLSAIGSTSASVGVSPQVVGVDAFTLVDSTNADGEAGVIWTLGTEAGTQSVSATVTGLAPVSFSATANAGAPSSIGGDASSAVAAPVSSTTDEPLAVVVKDGYGNPVPDATVTWTSLTTGASVAEATSTTGTDGVATVGATLGPTQDIYLFQVSIEGVALTDTLGVLGVLVTQDPSGDATATGSTDFNPADVTRIGATLIDSALVFYARFAGPIAAPVVGGTPSRSAVVGWIDLDLDQDTLTGLYPIRQCIGGPLLNFGVDAWIDLDPNSPGLSNFQNPPAGAVPVVLISSLDSEDRCGGVSGYGYAAVPLFTTRSVLLAVPLEFFGDDGTFGMTTTFANPGTYIATDFAPDGDAWVFQGAVTAAAQARLPQLHGLKYLHLQVSGRSGVAVRAGPRWRINR